MSHGRLLVLYVLFLNLFTLLLFYFLVTLDKLRCISTIKMNEFILYCLRFI